MAAGGLTLYDVFLDDLLKGVHDLENDTIVALLTTSSYTPNTSTHTQLSDVTNEVSGNGYSRQTLANPSVSGGVFDADDISLTASGGDIVSRNLVIFNDTSTNDKLIGYLPLDNTPADYTISDGDTLTIQWPSGTGKILQVTEA